jgi:hypothetical protein
VNGTNEGEIAATVLSEGSHGVVNFACKGGQGFGFEVRGTEEGVAVGWANRYMAPAVGFFLSVC